MCLSRWRRLCAGGAAGIALSRLPGKYALCCCRCCRCSRPSPAWYSSDCCSCAGHGADHGDHRPVHLCHVPGAEKYLYRALRRGGQVHRGGQGLRYDPAPDPGAGGAALALPSIIGGLRLSTVYTVSWAVLASMIGLGGWGTLFTRGFLQQQPAHHHRGHPGGHPGGGAGGADRPAAKARGAPRASEGGGEMSLMLVFEHLYIVLLAALLSLAWGCPWACSAICARRCAGPSSGWRTCCRRFRPWRCWASSWSLWGREAHGGHRHHPLLPAAIVRNTCLGLQEVPRA